jgi:AraC-like DNA-binding protein
VNTNPQVSLYAPHAALAGVISQIMIVEVNLGHTDCRITPFPPTPQNSIHFYPGDPLYTQHRLNGPFERSPESIVVGPQVSRVSLKMGEHHCIVSISFLPGGLYRLLGIPMHELFDDSYDAVYLLGNSVRTVNEKLKEACSHWQMKTIVEDFLLRRKLVKESYQPFDLTMQRLLQGGGMLSMDKAASLSCLSLRQFERRSKEVLGYSPKMFARLIRFSKAYRIKENNQNITWVQLAGACGYFDQMHMIRDFKEFTGVSPSSILQEISRSPMLVQQTLNL